MGQVVPDCCLNALGDKYLLRDTAGFSLHKSQFTATKKTISMKRMTALPTPSRMTSMQATSLGHCASHFAS